MNAKSIIIILIAFTAGYVVRMLVHPSDNDLVTMEPTPHDQAQLLVNNFTGSPKYYYVPKDVFNAMQVAISETDQIDGVVFYNAASSPDSEVADLTVVAGTARGVVFSPYQATETPSDIGSVVQVCPKMCDVIGLEIIETEDIDEVSTNTAEDLESEIENESSEDEELE